jgi:hypothetical protein
MNIIQRPPLFIGQSAIQNPEINVIDIIEIITNTTFYARPRDNSRYSFVEIRISGNYINSDIGNYLSVGNDIFIINSITREQIKASVVKNTLISGSETSIILKSLDSAIKGITTDWKIQLSISIDLTQDVYTCPPATNFRASSISSNSVKLTWKSGFGSEINYIRIKKRDELNWQKPYEVPGSIMFLEIRNLDPDTIYDCQICNRCELNNNNLYSDSISFSTII